MERMGSHSFEMVQKESRGCAAAREERGGGAGDLVIPRERPGQVQRPRRQVCPPAAGAAGAREWGNALVDGLGNASAVAREEILGAVASGLSTATLRCGTP